MIEAGSGGGGGCVQSKSDMIGLRFSRKYILPPFINIRYFNFVKQMYLNIF
jgi:hypothetical protein